MPRPQPTIDPHPATKPQTAVLPTALPALQTPSEVSQAARAIAASRNAADIETSAVPGDEEGPTCSRHLELLDTAPESFRGINPGTLTIGLELPRHE